MSAVEEFELSHDQLEVMNLFKSGKSFIQSGGGGCGKSFLIEQFKNHADANGKKIAITATTGTAAILLGCGAKTINAWAGIGLGTENIDVIITNIKTKGKYSSSIRWRTTDILVIDEASMMSCHVFELLNEIGKQIRNNKKPFGGIQIILSADFFQLPPIVKFSEEKKYIFESEIWPQSIKQAIFLTTNHRQSDPIFAQLLNEIRIGRVSEESREILNSRIGLDYESLEIKPTYLHSRNNIVDKINNEELYKLNNEIKEFSIQNALLDKAGNENGVNYSSREVKTIVDFMDKNQQYVQELKLCIDAQVMLLINLDVVNGLANGSRGIVKDFSEKGYPIVLFMNGITIEITPNTWYSDDNRIGRIQIPLKLAYAITIHKIQGATLDCALINLSNIFEDGQAYVALSRVRSLDGLYISDTITEFDYSKIKACPKVLAFYGYI
jgi:ATP-dependent DNA helicase PIF1